MSSVNAGINMSELFKNVTNNLDAEGAKLQEKIQSMSNSSGEVSQKDLLQLQILNGQYTAKLEAVSSMIKSMQDMLKTLAQRTG